MQSKMKQLLPLGLLVFSVNGYAETYSCAFKNGDQEIYTREGKQFKKITNFDLNDPKIKEICKIDKSTTFCKTGKSEDILSIVFENEEFIKLERFEKRKFLIFSQIVHINKKKSEVASASLLSTSKSTGFDNLNCVLIP